MIRSQVTFPCLGMIRSQMTFPCLLKCLQDNNFQFDFISFKPGLLYSSKMGFHKWATLYHKTGAMFSHHSSTCHQVSLFFLNR